MSEGQVQVEELFSYRLSISGLFVGAYGQHLEGSRSVQGEFGFQSVGVDVGVGIAGLGSFTEGRRTSCRPTPSCLQWIQVAGAGHPKEE